MYRWQEEFSLWDFSSASELDDITDRSQRPKRQFVFSSNAGNGGQESGRVSGVRCQLKTTDHWVMGVRHVQKITEKWRLKVS